MRKWYHPEGESGWKKTDTEQTRRRKVLKSHKNYLSAGRSLLALSNVTKDPTTKRKARADALYFFRKHREEK